MTEVVTVALTVAAFRGVATTRAQAAPGVAPHRTWVAWCTWVGSTVDTDTAWAKLGVHKGNPKQALHSRP